MEKGDTCSAVWREVRLVVGYDSAVWREVRLVIGYDSVVWR